jgi:hypothetical protein
MEERMNTTQIKFVEKLDELAWSTIAKAVQVGSSRVVLVMGDGRVASFGIDRGYESGDETIELEDALSDYEQFQAGLICEAEYNRLEGDRLKEAKRRSELAERQRYEQLRKKFG